MPTLADIRQRVAGGAAGNSLADIRRRITGQQPEARETGTVYVRSEALPTPPQATPRVETPTGRYIPVVAPEGAVTAELPTLAAPDPQTLGRTEPEMARPHWDEWIDAVARGLARMGSAGATAMAAVKEHGREVGTAWAPTEPGSAKEEAARWREKAEFLWKLSKHPEIAAQNKDLMSKGLNLIGETLPYITGTTAAYLAAGPAGGFAVSSLVEGNAAYRTALEHGVDEEKARKIGLGVGIIAGAIEAVGGRYTEELLTRSAQKITDKALRGGATFGIGTAVEALEEGGQEVAAVTGEKTYRDVDWGEAVNRTVGSMAGGAFLGGAMKGGGTALRLGGASALEALSHERVEEAAVPEPERKGEYAAEETTTPLPTIGEFAAEATKDLGPVVPPKQQTLSDIARRVREQGKVVEHERPEPIQSVAEHPQEKKETDHAKQKPEAGELHEDVTKPGRPEAPAGEREEAGPEEGGRGVRPGRPAEEETKVEPTAPPPATHEEPETKGKEPGEAGPEKPREPWEMTKEEYAESGVLREREVPYISFHEYAAAKGISLPTDWDYAKVIGGAFAETTRAGKGKLKAPIRRIAQAKEVAEEYREALRSGEIQTYTEKQPLDIATNEADAAYLRATHKRSIHKALDEGKPVPRRVLEDYKSEPWAKEALEKKEKPREAAEETGVEPAAGVEVGEGETNVPVQEPTGTLDPTNPKDAAEIVGLHRQWITGGARWEKRGSFGIWGPGDKLLYSEQQVDQAYRTIATEVESGSEDTTLWALPGKEKMVAALGQKMSRMGKLPSRTKKAAIGRPKALPRAGKTVADNIKAVYAGAGKNTDRWTLDAVAVFGEDLVATDGRRMFIAKGDWGKDGFYTDKVALKRGALGRPSSEKEFSFPKYKDLIPFRQSKPLRITDFATVWRRVRQAAIMAETEYGLPGVVVVANKDGSLGFAAATPDVGHAEINVQEGGKILGAVNPDYFQDAIAFHARRGSPEIELHWEGAEHPMLLRSPDGKTVVVQMPVSPEGLTEHAQRAIAGGPSEVQEQWREVEAKKAESPEEEATINVPSSQGGFVGGRPRAAGYAKVSAITQEDMKTGSKAADDFLRRNRGYHIRPNLMPGLRSALRHAATFAREFHFLPHLPKTAAFAEVREAIRHSMEIAKKSAIDAAEAMKWCLAPIKGVPQEVSKRYDALVMKLQADSLMEDIASGVDLPPGMEQADVEAMKAEADRLYEKYPSVRQAYDRLRQKTTEITDMLVDMGWLNAERAKEYYFPHKVIKYLQQQRAFLGVPRKLATPRKGYLKQRRGGYDYAIDLDYMVEHWAQVRRDIAMTKFLEKMCQKEQARHFKAKYPEWEPGDPIPAGFREITILPGRFYYRANGVTEDLATALINQNLGQIEAVLQTQEAKGLDSVRTVLALGRKRSFVVREEVANQVEDMPTAPMVGEQGAAAAIYNAIRNANTFVKRQILFNPLYAVPFHVTNFIGDAHKVAVALPGALKSKYMPGYWQAILAAHQGEKPVLFDEAQRYGVIGSGWIGVDVKSLKTMLPEIAKAEISGALEVFADKAKRLFNIAKTAGESREDWLRYATFAHLVDLQNKGVDITKYATKDTAVVRGLSGHEQAAKIARDILGDYSAIGKSGRILSDIAIPFYRWMHLNLPWWPRLIKEYAQRGNAGRGAAALLAAGGPYIAAMLWNYSDDERRKFEEKLPPWKRWTFHIVGLRGKKLYYVPLPLDDLINFFGIDSSLADYQAYAKGFIDQPTLVKRIAKNLVMEPGMGIVNAVGGVAAIPRDAFGIKTFPEFADYRIKDPRRRAINVAKDIFGAPAQLIEAYRRQDDQKVHDLWWRSILPARPWTPTSEPIDVLADNTYKADQEKWPYNPEKWRAHKGKEVKVSRLKAQASGLSREELQKARQARQQKKKPRKTIDETEAMLKALESLR